MKKCMFSAIVSKDSVYYTNCENDFAYQAVDFCVPILDREQLPVCPEHAVFLIGQGFKIFPLEPVEAESLTIQEITPL